MTLKVKNYTSNVRLWQYAFAHTHTFKNIDNYHHNANIFDTSANYNHNERNFKKRFDFIYT